MPDPTVPTTVRPIGLGRALLDLLSNRPRPAAPAAPAPAAPLPGDTWTSSPSPFQNRRFAAHADLAEVHGGKVLRAGTNSAGVAAVQRALIDMGFAVPGGPGGYYGSQTTQALKNFQVMAGLEPDGVLGPKTMAALDRFAPPPGKTSWDAGVNPGPLPDPQVAPGKRARVVVSVGQHRAFLFDKAGKLMKIYGVRTGTADHADGRGSATSAGVRAVTGKNADPTSVSNQLWPESGGRAFGDRLIDLTLVDPTTGRTLRGQNGQELHGTDQEGSIGRDYSHGCVGLKNADIKEIFDQLKVGDLVRFDS